MATNNAINLVKPFTGCNAYRSANLANQSGDGTVATAALNTEIFDSTSNFDTATYTYTCPTTGYYNIESGLEVYNLTTGTFTSFTATLVTTGESYILWTVNPNAYKDATGSQIFMLTNVIVKYLTATDTVKVTFALSGGTKTVGLAGGLGYSQVAITPLF